MATQTDKQTVHVVVRGSSKDFRQQITAGKHSFVADEPASVGGGDAGPDPYDYSANRAWRVHVNDNRILCAPKPSASGTH